jgi:hypothetical protein
MRGEVGIEREPGFIGHTPGFIGHTPGLFVSSYEAGIQRGALPGMSICFVDLGESKCNFGVPVNQTLAIGASP